ncbi:RNA-directed DNA polymerase from mobile element jockey [Chionoecetes opilio]|uniref:RNA-directed DNA polymerase from mobile element jockey n=1 Tax=Chionoecetes opilio TaxID=41210 RepID=A0A8J5CJD0_CHIOP|nr:RNA-directed DNA polymerase from mobile element jockey [Chionoecetes opilio]
MENQHGFRKGRSCLSKLLAHYNWFLETLAAGNNVDVVFLDFAKAFDKVDHGILLHKIKALGLRGKLRIWLHDFLTERVQSVVVDGQSSKEDTVMSGVPQGSVLGPLLFLIHMRDIGEEVSDSVLSSFADDTSISRLISNVQEVEHLQEDLNKVYSWATTNNMTFNEEKFEMLRCGPDCNIKTTTTLHTKGGSHITPTPHVKCLGVYLSADGSFSHHITETVRKARGMAGWVMKTFASREPEVMLTLWKALVQPLLDYCSQLWSPHKKADIQRLEAVQRSFTKHIRGLHDLNYWDRLKILGIYSKQRRRERYRAIYIWKVLEKQVPDPTSLALQAHLNERTGRKCSRRTLPSNAPGRCKTLLAASLAHEGPKIFNSLHKNVRNITGCSVNTFKYGLDKILRTVPDKPPVPGYTAKCRTSNTIPDQVALLDRDARTGSSGGPPRL